MERLLKCGNIQVVIYNLLRSFIKLAIIFDVCAAWKDVVAGPKPGRVCASGPLARRGGRELQKFYADVPNRAKCKGRQLA